MIRKLLVLHDSPDFGGHEKMLLTLLPAVLNGGSPFDEIVFCLPRMNSRLRNALSGLSPRLRVVDWSFVKQRGEPYLHRFRFGYRAAVRAIVARERPDTVLLVQGRIEHLAVPAAVLPHGLRVVSYVPMAHSMADIGRRGSFGDRFRRPLYARPDHFIVPSEAVAAQVAAAGGTAPVTVAHNVVAPPEPMAKAAARDALNLPQDRRIALFLGRLDAAQKGLDILVEAIARAGADRLRNWTFVFVGDGPARALIEGAAATTGADIRLVAWSDTPGSYLRAADAMLLPSRWEGVPLVMLEAMHAGLPILASPIDTCLLHLPAANLVDFATVDLADALDAATTPAATASFAAAAQERLRGQTLAAARAAFVAALVGAR